MRVSRHLLTLLAATTFARAEPTCNLLTFSVDLTALNIELPLNYSGLTPDALDVLPRIQIQGAHNIAARYCEPEVDNATRKNALQLLVHGVVRPALDF